MPTTDWRVAFFRRAFLRHAPRRYALMLTPDEAHRLGQKYMEQRGMITDTMITRHLAGAISLAAPAAVDGRAHLLPLDLDASGIDAIQTLIAEAARRKLWAFGQYCWRDGLAETDQHGYVWLPFDRQADAQRLQALGAQLIAANPSVGLEDRGARLPRGHPAAVGAPYAHGSLRRPGDRRSVDQHRPEPRRRARRAPPRLSRELERQPA